MSQVQIMRMLQDKAEDLAISKSELIAVGLELLFRAPDEAIRTAVGCRRVRLHPSYNQMERVVSFN